MPDVCVQAWCHGYCSTLQLHSLMAVHYVLGAVTGGASGVSQTWNAETRMCGIFYESSVYAVFIAFVGEMTTGAASPRNLWGEKWFCLVVLRSRWGIWARADCGEEMDRQLDEWMNEWQWLAERKRQGSASDLDALRKRGGCQDLIRALTSFSGAVKEEHSARQRDICSLIHFWFSVSLSLSTVYPPCPAVI